MENVKYFIYGVMIGFIFGFLIMNIPEVMQKSATYDRLQKQRVIERRNNEKIFTRN